MNKDKDRSLGSDDDGPLLAGFLNASDGSWGYPAEPHRRVRELVLQLATLREKADQQILPSDEETDAINASLKNYPWVLRVIYRTMIRAGKISRLPKPVFTDWQAAPDAAQSFAVMAINLARSGRLERLRRCAYCRAWFFAKDPRGTYCPGIAIRGKRGQSKCKQKMHRSKPGYAEKNRQYQKKHTQTLKEMAGLAKEKKRGKKR